MAIVLKKSAATRFAMFAVSGALSLSAFAAEVTGAGATFPAPLYA